MNHKQNHIVNICLALIVASATILLSETAFFKRLELLSQDSLLHLRPNTPHPPKDIAVIEITDKEIKKIGRWSWERSWLVKMTNALIDLQPKEVLYDFIMIAKSIEPADTQLQQAIQRAGNVYLPSYWKLNEMGKREKVEPLDRFAKHAKGVGFINIVADIDGSYRKIPLYSDEEGGVQYNIMLKIIMDRLGLNVSSIEPKALKLSGQGSEISIPLVEGNNMLLNWYGPWKKSFSRYSFLDILQAHEDIQNGKEPAIDVKPLKDSLVIVAVTATGLYDIKPVPLEPHYPGAGIVATTLANILDRSFIKSVPEWFTTLFIYLLVLVPPFLILQERPIKEILNISAGFAVFAFDYVLYLNGYRVSFSTPLVALLGSYVVVTSYNFTTYKALSLKIEEEQKANLRLQKKYKGLEDDLAETEKEKENLEKVNKELDQFVRTVSHDIRSPLLAIVGYADLLQKKIRGSISASENTLLDGIFGSIDRLNTLIDDMLKTTKISRVKNPYERVNVNGLIRKITERLAFQIEESKAVITVQGELPHIICDRIKLGEVFQNLMTNAIKFSSKSGNVPKIEISCKVHGRTYEFCVKDNGIGIDPKDHVAIFDLHKRAVSSEDFDGSGVGLNIVKKIVDDHGGRVWVESSLGRGAAFYFTISRDL